MGQFHEVQFSQEISRGSSGGPGYKNNIIEQANAVDERVARQSIPRWRFNVAYGIRSMEDLAAVQRFYVARRGVLIGFRYKDFLDFHSNPTNPTYTSLQGDQDQLIGTGTGSLTTFQLIKRYTDGVGAAIIRTIRKPVENTVEIWVNSTLKTEGVDYTVDHTTGIVTFASAPANGHAVEASYEFDVPVRFGKEIDEELAASINAFDSGDIPDIPLVEDLDPDIGYVGDLFYGGAKEGAVSSLDLAITPALGQVWPVKMEASGKFVLLPALADVPHGRNILSIINDGSIDFGIKTSTGTTLVAALAPGEFVDAHVMVDGASAKVWLLA